MFPEFALTPAAFEESAHSGQYDLRDCLRELGYNLFPNTSGWPAVVADLHGGTWWQLVEPELRSLTQTPSGSLLRNLLERLPQVLVNRPACQDWPVTEADWLDEACQTHRMLPLHRVLTSQTHFEALDAEFQTVDKPRVGPLSEIFEAGYWDDVKSHASPEMNIAHQVGMLRTITSHSDEVHFLNPYISGDDGRKRDIDFAISLIQAVQRRHADLAPNPSTFIHTLGIKDDPSTPDGQTRLANRAKGISDIIGPRLVRASSVRLLLWPDFKERHVIGCKRVETSDGSIRGKPRWGVYLGHVARTGDSLDMEETRWRLLDNNELSKLFEKYGKQAQSPQWTGTIPGPSR
jgi:hypothetical protein